MASPFVSGRVPQTLHDRFVEFCQDSGKSKSEALIEALEAYLGIPHQSEGQISYEALETLLAPIRERLAVVENKLITDDDCLGESPA